MAAAPPRRVVVAVDGRRITAAGDDLGRGRRDIDAAGWLLLPRWVDSRAHYDGQATWDAELAPSCWHGRHRGRVGQLRGRFRAGASGQRTVSLSGRQARAVRSSRNSDPGATQVTSS